jgi:glycosyltransferase involved in cell wall biosynthesis
MIGMATSVSVALIVKNEERVLGRCLESLRDAVDEIVVVDTGSEDDSKGVAQRFTDKLYDFVWCDDFAAARQFAFDRTTTDWVAWVDADDVVLHADRIKPLLASTPPEVCGYYWRYVYGWDPSGIPALEFWRERCVRNDGSFRWVGRVHEVLVPQWPCTQLRNHDIIVEHHRDPEHGARNQGRNLKILEDEYEASTGTLEPRMLFYLGREYADAGNTERAIEVLQHYVEVGEWEDERFRAQIQIAQLHRVRGHYQLALDADLEALKIHPRWPDAYFGLAQTYYYLRDWPKVIHWSDIGRAMPVPQTKVFINPRDYDCNWIIYYTNALYNIGDLEAALGWTRRGLEIRPDDPWHQQNVSAFERELGMRRQETCPPEEASEASLPTADLPIYAVIPVRDRHHLTRQLLAQLRLPAERVIIVDNGSTVPAAQALAGLARVVEHPMRNISQLWNVGLDLVAAESSGPYNVAVLNNDLEVGPGFLERLAAGLRAQPDHVVAYPDQSGQLPADSYDPDGRMTGHAFMLRGEDGMRADPRFVWSYGDDDIERQGRARGKVVRVGGVEIRHLEHNSSTLASPELQATAKRDRERFLAKWERPEVNPLTEANPDGEVLGEDLTTESGNHLAQPD